MSESKPVIEKRNLLDFMLSNCRWKDGVLEDDYRQPFDLLAVTATEAAVAGATCRHQF